MKLHSEYMNEKPVQPTYGKICGLSHCVSVAATKDPSPITDHRPSTMTDHDFRLRAKTMTMTMKIFGNSTGR